MKVCGPVDFWLSQFTARTPPPGCGITQIGIHAKISATLSKWFPLVRYEIFWDGLQDLAIAQAADAEGHTHPGLRPHAPDVPAPGAQFPPHRRRGQCREATARVSYCNRPSALPIAVS